MTSCFVYSGQDHVRSRSVPSAQVAAADRSRIRATVTGRYRPGRPREGHAARQDLCAARQGKQRPRVGHRWIA